MEKKPSDFMNVFPLDSVLGNNENESMACSLMRTMHANGDKWAIPPYKDYLEFRKNNGGGQPGGVDQYENIIPYLKSPDTAALFSKSWKEITNKQ